MSEEIGLLKVGMEIIDGCLIVPVQVELYDETVRQLQKEVLENVERRPVKGVLIDVSTVAVIDTFIAVKLIETAKMTSLMGARTVITGVKPEVAVSVLDLGVDFKNIETAVNLEEGFRMLRPSPVRADELREIESGLEIDLEASLNDIKHIEILEAIDVAEAVNVAVRRCRAMGLGTIDQNMVAISVSELARNVLYHAKTGSVTIKAIDGEGEKGGIEVIVEDEGPGIKDIDQAMVEGYSTANSLGLGLPGAKRLMDEFEFDAEREIGTKITVKKWK